MATNRTVLVLLGGALALSCAAFLPPESVRDGMAVRIEGFAEKTDSKDLQVATRDADKPFLVSVSLVNTGAKPVSGRFMAWMNDDWEVFGTPSEPLSLKAASTQTVTMTACAKPGRALPALYPIHAVFAPGGGEPLHAIAIFRAELPAAAKKAAETVVKEDGFTRLRDLPSTAWTSVRGKVAPLEGGQTGASFAMGMYSAGGESKAAFTCHPPWRQGAGAVWRDFDLELPKVSRCTLAFSIALGMNSSSEPKSDGTEHKVFVVDAKGATNEIFSALATSFGWKECRADLSRWAGQRAVLRLWTGPGPKMNTTCDRCAWGEPLVFAGTPPAAPSDEDWTARERAAAESARAALKNGSDPARARFRLDAGDDTCGAAWEFGPRGMFDGVLAFADAERTLTFRGFFCDVDEQAVGTGLVDAMCRRFVARAADGALEVTHEVKADGRLLTLRARLWTEKGTLRLRWDMPGATRDMRGHPRYTRLCVGNCSLPAARAYAGFGNVVENPRNFAISDGGFGLSARHVGADYANGLSLVQASDVFPDRLVCAREKGRFSLETHHDATFTFVPSARGAFAAARRFRDVCGYRKSPGWAEAAKRMCLDQWGGDYALAAKDLALAGKYGLGESVFVKHVWQRWGYDYRLPDIYPPLGRGEDFLAMRAAAKKAGILFSPHDNYIDFYPDAEGYSYDHMLFNRDGTPQKAWYNSGRRALSYRWAPHTFMPWLDRNMDLMRDGFAPDSIFIDVFTAKAPMDYWDREGRFHDKMETQREWGRAFDRCRERLGQPTGVMISEAGTDALVGHLDAGQSDHFGANRWMSSAEFDDFERTPWHDMATHGTFVLLAGGLGSRYCALDWQKAGNNLLHGYASDDYLGNTVIGGRTPMCGGPFGRGAVMTYWLLHDVCKALAFADFEELSFEGNIHRQHSRFSNGGEVWLNRLTNGAPWKVAGYELPAYGFYAKAPGVEAGVVRIDGQRCAFARSEGLTFVDARPRHANGKMPMAVSRAMAARTLSPSACRISVEWETFEPVVDYRPFVHVVPEGGGETPIIFQCGMGLSSNMLATTGRHETEIDIRLPANLPAGRYDVRYGAFTHGGHRLSVRGLDDGLARICGGTLKVERSGGALSGLSWEAPRPLRDESELEINLEGRRLRFAGVETDGAFRLEHPRNGGWRIVPLPGSYPFGATLDLAALGAPGAVAAVEAIDAAKAGRPPTWRQNGTSLELELDARAFGYAIRFANVK